MTRRWFVAAAVCAVLTGASAQSVAPKKPKLVVGIVIDQFRYDYLTRFRTDYDGGLARLLARGAVFTNARYEHFPTVTAIGHSIFMTGATPSLSGIIGNEWYDRESAKMVTSVSDPATELLGGRKQAGSSPRKLVVSTLGDELKAASRGHSKVVGISIKDRAAILPSGHSSDGAYWFDAETGTFVSSTFYFPDLPGWVKEFNAARPADRYLNAEWKPLIPNPDYAAFSKKMAATASPAFYGSLEAAPYGNELIEAFAERAITGEQLGTHPTPDLLTVSFSANDYVGHGVGPDAPEVRDMAIRVDRTIGKLLDFVDQKVGLANTLVVLTGDHGVAPIPEALAERKMPGGRMSSKTISEAMETSLRERFGEGKWLLGWSGTEPYLNQELIRTHKLDAAEVEKVAAVAVAHLPHIYRVYTREQLLNGGGLDDVITRKVVNGFFPSRAGDLVILAEPYWIEGAHGASHGAPFIYDSHVPMIFLGANIKPGRYDATTSPMDIAPTLATMLDVETPSGSLGRVLTDMLIAQ